MTELLGERVRLRPFREDELDVLLASRQRELASGLSALGTISKDVLRSRIEGSGAFTPWGEILFAIEAENRLVGEIQARRSEDVLPPGVYELGIEIYDDADRGKSFGSEAIAVLTSHLFEAEGAHRAQASTDVENLPMRRVLERLGFSYEGVLRGFMPSSRGPLDYALYAVTREDWENARITWTFRS